MASLGLAGHDRVRQRPRTALGRGRGQLLDLAASSARPLAGAERELLELAHQPLLALADVRDERTGGFGASSSPSSAREPCTHFGSSHGLTLLGADVAAGPLTASWRRAGRLDAPVLAGEERDRRVRRHRPRAPPASGSSSFSFQRSAPSTMMNRRPMANVIALSAARRPPASPRRPRRARALRAALASASARRRARRSAIRPWSSPWIRYAGLNAARRSARAAVPAPGAHDDVDELVGHHDHLRDLVPVDVGLHPAGVQAEPRAPRGRPGRARDAVTDLPLTWQTSSTCRPGASPGSASGHGSSHTRARSAARRPRRRGAARRGTAAMRRSRWRSAAPPASAVGMAVDLVDQLHDRGDRRVEAEAAACRA